MDEWGKQHYLDVHVAYRQACLNAIEYMTTMGRNTAPGSLELTLLEATQPLVGRRRGSAGCGGVGQLLDRIESSLLAEVNNGEADPTKEQRQQHGRAGALVS